VALRGVLSEMLALLLAVEFVGEARDGLEAVRLAETADPGIFLLDVQMPGLDGIEATRIPYPRGRRRPKRDPSPVDGARALPHHR
jgi:CheY-like chemotaxis protein